MAKTYSEKLRDPRWQKKRLEILSRDNFTCSLCGDTETTLHVHHSEYCREPWDADSKKLHTCCEICHAAITSGDGGSYEFKTIKIIKKECYDNLLVMQLCSTNINTLVIKVSKYENGVISLLHLIPDFDFNDLRLLMDYNKSING